MWVLMAVTDMQKLTVIGLNSSRTPFLHELMRLGVVEINSQEGVVNDEEWMPDIFRTSNSADVSRLEAGTLNPALQEVYLPKLAQEAADTVAPSAREKHLELNVQVPDITLQADEKLLRRVLINLLSNAVKFTQAGFVRLEAKEEPGRVLISVTDSGVGIALKDQQTIFEKYHQVRSDSRGYGLGLFISRQIACAHGGDIVVSSEPGKGSTFTVTLPKEKK